MAKALDTAERVEVTSRKQWRAWLKRHQAQSEGVWLVTYKKHCGERHLPWDAIVEEAICVGWIDGLVRKLDADRTLRYVSPRRPGSPWSPLNKRRVEALEAAGRIQPRGAEAIAAAKKDGSWTVLDDIEALIEPDDFKAALDATPGARDGYEGFPPSARRGLLWWIKTAKREATRRKRIDASVAGAAKGVVANQP